MKTRSASEGLWEGKGLVCFSKLPSSVCVALSSLLSAQASAQPRVNTHPSWLDSSRRRPGGSGSTRRASAQLGSILRICVQHRYCNVVGAECERISFMLLLAAVEQTIGYRRLFCK